MDERVVVWVQAAFNGAVGALQLHLDDDSMDDSGLKRIADVFRPGLCEALGIACHGLTEQIDKALQPLLTKQSDFAAWTSSEQVKTSVTVAKTLAACQSSPLIAMTDTSVLTKGFSIMRDLVELADLLLRAAELSLVENLPCKQLQQFSKDASDFIAKFVEAEEGSLRQGSALMQCICNDTKDIRRVIAEQRDKGAGLMKTLVDSLKERFGECIEILPFWDPLPEAAYLQRLKAWDIAPTYVAEVPPPSLHIISF